MIEISGNGNYPVLGGLDHIVDIGIKQLKIIRFLKIWTVLECGALFSLSVF